MDEEAICEGDCTVAHCCTVERDPPSSPPPPSTPSSKWLAEVARQLASFARGLLTDRAVAVISLLLMFFQWRRMVNAKILTRLGATPTAPAWPTCQTLESARTACLTAPRSRSTTWTRWEKRLEYSRWNGVPRTAVKALMGRGSLAHLPQDAYMPLRSRL